MSFTRCRAKPISSNVLQRFLCGTPISVAIRGEKIDYLGEYLGVVFKSDALCEDEIKARLLQGRQRMGQLTRLWRSRTLTDKLKARLIQALVWPIVTYGAEAWTLKLEQRENIEAFEMWCYRRALRISYVEHVSNDEVLSRMSQSRKLLNRVKSRKLKYFGHVVRHPSMEKDIMIGHNAWDTSARRAKTAVAG